MNINQSAQEMVDAIAQIVSNRTINIMDKNAMIIASSDPKRIGTFHQGAAEVIASGKMVCISKDDLSHYEGAKEGINLPITLDGKLFGVVGIYGNPDEVKDAANLLCIYVRQYFSQMALIEKEHMQSEFRSQLLKLLIFNYNGSVEEIHQLSTLIGIKFRMPMRAIVISLGENCTDALQKLKCMDKLPEILINSGLLNPTFDLYSILDDRFVLLKQTDNIQNMTAFLHNIHQTVSAGQKLNVSTAIGESYRSINQLHFSYQEALTLVQNGEGCYSMDDNKTKLDYLFYSLQKIDGARFPMLMYHLLEENFGQQEVDWVMSSIQAFYDCCGSINKAAAILHIHKNTMIYRMKRIYSVLKLDEEDNFTKRCFLKILLVYYNRLKG